MLRSTFFAVALGIVGFLTAPSAEACTWMLGSDVPRNVSLGTSYTQPGTVPPGAPLGAMCGSSLTLAPVGPDNPELFNKFLPNGSERGIGLTNDLNGGNEVTPGSSILIDISFVIDRTGTMALSVDANSVQAGDTWELLDSTGQMLIRPNGNNRVSISFTTMDTLLTFTAFSGDVLLSSFESPEQFLPPTPEPASVAILGAALVGFGVMRRRRKL